MIDFELIIDGLTKKYGDKKILSSINCVYKSSCIHGIIGANGSGKTTFFNCITRNLSYKGNIIFPEGIRIGYLPTELYMYPRITGMEFIQFCLTSKNIKPDYKVIADLNEIFELSLNEYAQTYSTGMLKKLYLFVLILEKNEVLILDEPFNGLDISAVSYITELLQRLKQNGTLILISSHIVAHLCSFCDTLSLIENEQIRFESDKEEFGYIEAHINEGTRLKFEVLNHINF